MALGIEVSLVKDDASPAIRGVVAGLQPSAVNPIIGRSAVNAYRSHLFALNESRANALGGQRTNFYAQAARGTSFTIAGDFVIVSIASVGIAQRYFGGTIKPVRSKFLTIPARAEAHGKRASEFKDLQLLWNRNGPFALARRLSTAITIGRRSADGVRAIGRGKLQGGEILFWLKKEVTQKPDVSVLPTQLALQENIQRDVFAYTQRIIDRSTGGPN